ncbi:hypothetical protein QYF36_018360 [Acer negundo]|nr:hypothetical protein QYF36_018360 [Acer negundo]
MYNHYRIYIEEIFGTLVNPATEDLAKSGRDEDGAIHNPAGPELRNACKEFPKLRCKCRCPVGEARITPGFKLPVSHVIHAVGPERRAGGPGGDPEAEALLRSAYRNSMRLAKENNVHYIAFPGISTIKESFVRFPFEEAAVIALSTVKEQANDFKEQLPKRPYCVLQREMLEEAIKYQLVD